MNLSTYKPIIAKTALIFSSVCIGIHYGPEVKQLYSRAKDSFFGSELLEPSYENAQLLVRYVYEAKK